MPSPIIAGSEVGSTVPELPTTLIDLLEWQLDTLVTEGGDVRIDVVAESLGMSRRSLQRAIAAEGLNYSDVLAQRRLHRAMQWLDTTDKPVMDIALSLGYTDASNFSRAFRRHTGVSPRAFRRAGVQG